MGPILMKRLGAMKRMRLLGCSLSVALLLAGCSSVEQMFDEPIEPSPSTASSSSGVRTLAHISDDGTPQSPPPVSVTQPPDLSRSQRTVQATPTGTFVGKKAVQISGDFSNVQQSIKTHNGQFAQSRTKTQGLAEQYYSTVASINTRLQAGTTPGNPLLGQEWDSAQTKLTEISNKILRLQELRNLVATDATTAGFLLDQVKAAYSLSGAVDEDHRQLAVLEDRINREIVSVERLLTQIDTDVTRQSAYIASERLNMTTLALAIKSGQPYGPNLSNAIPPIAAKTSTKPTSRRVSITRSRGNKSSGVNTASASGGRQPILVIDFESANTAYESSLYAAVSEVVARRPAAGFEVIAVTPGAKPGASPTASRRNSKRVVRSLVNMGVPEARLRESAKTSPAAVAEQVLVYAL